MNILKKNEIELKILSGEHVSVEDMTELLKQYVKSWFLNKDEIKCLKAMRENKEFMELNAREYSMIYIHNVIELPQLITREECKPQTSLADSLNIFLRETAMI